MHLVDHVKLRKFSTPSSLLFFMLIILESKWPIYASIADTDHRGVSMHEQKYQPLVGAVTIKPEVSRDQFEGSGANPDDEDGDVVEGSGDGFEGSGAPLESDDEKRKLQSIKTPETSHQSGQKQTTTSIGLQNVQQKSTASGSSIQSTTSNTTILITTTAAPTIRSTTNTPLRISTTYTTFIPPPRFIVPSTTEQKPLLTSTTLPTARPQPPPYILDPTITLEQLKPGMFALIIGAIVVFVLLIILLATYIMYRIRKKDEGSYSCEEPSVQPHHYSYAYQKASIKEFYA